MSGAISSMNAVSGGDVDAFYDPSAPAALRGPFPVVLGTPEGDEAFKEVALKFRTSKRLQLVPEVENDSFLRAVESIGVRFAPRWNPWLDNDRVRAMMSCALYAWNPTDEQVMAAFAVAEASGTMDFDLGGSITPRHLAIAALAPGAEDSTLVRSLASPLGSLTAGELGNWLTIMRHRVLGLMGEEVQRHGFVDGEMITPRRDGRKLSARIESAMTLSDANWLRRRCLHCVGKQYLSQVIASNFHDMDIFLAVDADGDATKEDILGAETLLSLFPGESPLKEPSPEDLLPLEFLLALPSFKTARLGEFHALVEEYNVDWALASMDWSGGGEGEH